jgi:hypothetical protein
MGRMRTRPGVVLTEICGEYVLVSAKAIAKDCPFVTCINEESAFLWTQLINGADEDELVAAVNAEYEVDSLDTLLDAIRGFLREMNERNLLIED